MKKAALLLVVLGFATSAVGVAIGWRLTALAVIGGLVGGLIVNVIVNLIGGVR